MLPADEGIFLFRGQANKFNGSHMIERPYQIEYARNVCETKVPDALDCWVKFNHCKCELPFTAAAWDSEPHGRDLYERLRAGEFGEIHPSGSFDGVARGMNSPREIGLTQDKLSFLGQGLEEANLENSCGTSRGIVLVWSALLEIALSEAIRSRLPHDTVRKTLGGKINQLKENSLFSDADDYEDLMAIRDIRNHAAHSLQFSRFEHLRENINVFEAYKRLYCGYAEAMFHEVNDLLFVVRIVFSSACLGLIERVWRMKIG